jgi:hypothetical protein
MLARPGASGRCLRTRSGVDSLCADRVRFGMATVMPGIKVVETTRALACHVGSISVPCGGATRSNSSWVAAVNNGGLERDYRLTNDTAPINARREFEQEWLRPQLTFIETRLWRVFTAYIKKRGGKNPRGRN